MFKFNSHVNEFSSSLENKNKINIKSNVNTCADETQFLKTSSSHAGRSL